jgi:predicted nuclease of predicted toxin-antitoxin system
MKLLFDQNISYRIVKKVSDKFIGCVHVSSYGLSDANDTEIWLYAKNHDFAIVTSDSDFYDFALIRGIPPKIIWIRHGNLTTAQVAERLLKNHQTIISFLSDDANSEDNACLEL